MQFELKHTTADSKARAGFITTDHGTIETPIFMPVGTAGSVKGIHKRDLKDDIGAQNYSWKYLSFVFTSGFVHH